MKKKLTVKKLILIGLIGLFTIGYIRQVITMKRIQKEIVDKQTQLEEIQQKNERLRDEVNKIDGDSQEYLEKLARERLGMIKPGEKVVNDESKN